MHSDNRPPLPSPSTTLTEGSEESTHGRFPPVRIWGVPLTPITGDEVLDEVDRLIERREPSYFITANLHYSMLSAAEKLDAINDAAAFIVADGMPQVWYSRLRGTPLPERVAGSDLIFSLCGRAAARGHRVFLLGAAPGVAEIARDRLCERFPGLEIVGIAAPSLAQLDEKGERALIESIRAARPDLLFAALGQPRGERWLHRHREALGVPVCVQVGASIDFAAGRVSRAPRWMQKTGVEWIYRITREPRRMIPRYWSNGMFLLRAVLADLRGHRARR